MSKQIVQCPHCKAYGKHITKGYDSAHYRWTQQDSQFFEEISGRDLAARMATKQCKKCDFTFRTIELSLDVFDELVRHTKVQRAQVSYLEQAWSQLLIEYKKCSPLTSAAEIARNPYVMYEFPSGLDEKAVAACLNDALDSEDFLTGATGQALGVWANWDVIRHALCKLPKNILVFLCLNYGFWTDAIDAREAASHAEVNLDHLRLVPANESYAEIGNEVVDKFRELEKNFRQRPEDKLRSYSLHLLREALDGATLVNAEGVAVEMKMRSCGCGKYQGEKYRGIICETCGISVMTPGSDYAVGELATFALGDESQQR